MTPEIEKSVRYLQTSEALESIERDPYWPKWNSPWWHMCILNELSLAQEIPSLTIRKMTKVLKGYYLPVFPITEAELPPGTDPYRKTACHCALGNMYQVLFNASVDMDHELPWMREWFFRYQLPDGGLNCDEKAYTRANPKSSLVSTIACLEAVLFSRKGELKPQEKSFLDKGANYLVQHQLFRRVSDKTVIDQDWLEIRFPRFYEYDFLRGYFFLEKWRQASGFTIPDDLVDEVEKLVSHQMTPNGIQLRRYNHFEKRSYNPSAGTQWTWGQSSEFDLMKAVSYDGCYSPVLTHQWNQVKPRSAEVVESYSTIYKDPIRLKKGEGVRVEKHETNPDWLGWVYCRDSRGVAGWVSSQYLREEGPAATVIKDYDATELDCSVGEPLKIYFEEFGWCWCRNSKGTKGWVPKKNLRIR